MVGVNHRHLESTRRDRATLVHADDLDAGVAKLRLQPQRQLVNRDPSWLRRARDRQGIGVRDIARCRADVIEVAVRHEHQVALSDVGGGARRGGIAEPRIEDERLATGRAQLDARMSVPGEAAVGIGHRSRLPMLSA